MATLAQTRARVLRTKKNSTAKARYSQNSTDSDHDG